VNARRLDARIIALETEWRWSIVAIEHAAERCTNLEAPSSSVVPVQPQARSQRPNTRHPQGLAGRDGLAAFFTLLAEFGESAGNP
jgi:hypothetical protein